MLDAPNPPQAAYDSAIIPARDRPVARLVSWVPWSLPNAHLIGHAAVAFNSGWVINSIPIFKRGDGSLSAGSPSMPVVDAAGRQKVDAVGKKQYLAVITFEGAGRELWSRTIIAALLAAGIDPLAREGGA